MSRCVIVSGAEIGDYVAIRKYLKNDDFIIFCDCGLRHQKELGIKANLIVGDFDSYTRPDTETDTIILPCEKDDTDTVYAVKEALSRGFEDFLLIGVCGGRLDHTLGNVSILLKLHSAGKSALIVDDFSEMEIVSNEAKYIDNSFAYFSLINIDGVCRGVYEKNAKFPLENGEIDAEYQYGISNEPLPGKTAEVCVKEGRALLVKVRR